MKTKLVLALGVFALAFYVTLPSDRYALDGTCQPDGLLARTREMLHPKDFWASQLRAARRQIASIKAFPAAMARIKAISNEALSKMDDELRRITKEQEPRLKIPPKSRAEQLREMADEAEHEETMALLMQFNAKRLVVIQRCEASTMGR